MRRRAGHACSERRSGTLDHQPSFAGMLAPHASMVRMDRSARSAIQPARLTVTPLPPPVVRHGVLRLTFSDGLRGELDVLDRMRGPVFAQARAPDGFAQVTVDPEIGTIVWPGGADLAPETLYERLRTGVWPDQAAAHVGQPAGRRCVLASKGEPTRLAVGSPR